MTGFQRHIAIGIGINQYGHGIATLQTAVQDAQTLVATLKNEHHYQVIEMVDEAATLAKLRTLFHDKLPRTVTDKDCLLIYFAGHGIAKEPSSTKTRSGEPKTEGPIGYLIPQDARPEDEGTFLPMQEMYQAMETLPCRHFLLILDCCFAGAFRWASTRDVLVPERMYRERFLRFQSQAAWQVLTSASHDQKALDILRDNRGIAQGNLDHSPFAAALFEALAGKADLIRDKVITATELYLYLRDAVERKSRERQTPGLWPLPKHDRGEFFFLTRDFDAEKLDPAPTLNPDNNPYRGLQAYEERHGNLFFGRDKLIKRLYTDHVKPNALTVVVGASGTGKSSLVKAGLIPFLKGESFFDRRREFKDTEVRVTELWVTLPILRPGNDPLSALAQMMLPFAQEAAETATLYSEALTALADFQAVVQARQADLPKSFVKAWQSLEQQPKTQMTLALEWAKTLENWLTRPLSGGSTGAEGADQAKLNALISATQACVKHLTQQLNQDDTLLKTLLSDWLSQNPQAHLLLVVDQAEELITQVRDEAVRQRFVHYLESALAAFPQRLHAVLTVRMDFEPLVQQLFSQPWQTGWTEKYRLVVPPMTQDDLRQAIEGPANEAVLHFDPASLVDELINEVVQMPGALPLLSFVLSELYLKCAKRWSEDNPGRALKQKDYENLGKVSGALRSRANEEFNALDEAGQRTLRNIMLRMVAFEGGELARRRVPRTELDYSEAEENERVKAILNRLIEQRLVIAGRSTEGEYVEPAHDVLVRGWEKIGEWQEHLGAVLLQRDLTSGANEWEASGKKGRDTGLLWVEDPRLSTALQISCGRAYRDNWINLFRWRLRYQDWHSKSYEHWLNIKESNFVWQSFKQKFNRFGRNTLTIAGVIFALSGLTLEAWRRAEIAQLREQSARAINLLSTNDPVQGMVLAIDTMNRSSLIPDVKVSAQDSLLRSIQTSMEENYFNGHGGWVNSVAFSPDGKQVASGSGDGTVRIWDTQTGQQIGQPLQGYGDVVWSVTFSPDGQRIVSGSGDGKLRQWDTQTHEIIGPLLEGHKDKVLAIAFSPDGQRIVSGSSDHTLRIWDAKSGQPISEPLEGHNQAVWAIAFSPDGQRIVSGSDDATLRIWDVQSGRSVSSPLTGHHSWVRSVDFSPDGTQVVSGSADGDLRLWSVQSGKSVGSPLQSHRGGVRSVAFSPDGSRIVSGSDDWTLQLWDAQAHEPLGEPLRGHNNQVRTVVFSLDGKHIISGSLDKTVRLWNAHGFEELKISQQNLQEPRDIGVIISASFSPDLQWIISGSNNGTVSLWDLITGKPVYHSTSRIRLSDFHAYQKRIRSVAFNPNFTSFVSATYIRYSNFDPVLELWDVDTGEPIGKPIHGHKEPINSVAFSPDGKRIVSGSDDQTLQLWDAQTGHSISGSMRSHKEPINSVAFSPDGKRIVSGSDDQTLQLWDAQTNKPIGDAITGHKSWIFSVIFSPDGKQIASSGGDRTLRRWNTLTGKPIGQPIQSYAGDLVMAFSPDSQTLAGLSGYRMDGTKPEIQLWDARSGRPIGQPLPVSRQGWAGYIAFSPNGQNVISLSGNRIETWTVSPNKWLAIACDRLRYHPLLSHPETITADPDFVKLTKRSKSACQRYAWDGP